MSITVEQDTTLNLNQAKILMTEKIKEVYASHASIVRSIDESTVARLEVAVDDIPPLSWLAAQENRVKTYWLDRQDKFEMAGIGTADIVSGEGNIDHDLLFTRLNETLIGNNKNLRYYGGLRFSEKNESLHDTSWEDFGSYRFVLSRFELVRQPSGTHLACNVFVGSNRSDLDTVLSELRDIVSLTESDNSELPGIRTRSDNPEKVSWHAMVKAALESIDKTKLEKLVLARQTRFDFSVRPEPLHLLERLKQATPGCYHFCFQLDDDLAFVGASPERLYQRSNQTIKSEALAGTCPRGISKDADEALGEQLLHSEKDLREHQYVVAYVEEALENLCPRGIRKGDMSLLKLTTVQHLVTYFESTLAPDVSDGEILAAMHPTPAVGGYPVDLAIEKIQELEPFDRGWYAGPVGWVGRDAAEFAVAIRSGLIVNDILHLFAGAGVVKGSTAESEWMEIENKLSSFTRRLLKE